MSISTIVWFRNDLRLTDNTAWEAARSRGGVVFPVYIHAPGEEGEWAPGAASRWWLHYALEDLARALDSRGLRLIVREGPTAQMLEELVRESGCDAVYWSRRYEPVITRRDAALKEALGNEGIAARSFNSSLLFEPWQIRSGTGGAYRVYTPFGRTVMALGYPQPVGSEADDNGVVPSRWPESLPIEQLGLLPSIGWDKGIRNAWQPTRKGALERLEAFLARPVLEYADDRNLPDREGTSRLSPYLHFGQIGPREIVERALRGEAGNGRDTFLKEVLWREFSHHVLYHFPHTPAEPLQEGFRNFTWRRDPEALEAWQKGRTGYPIVDAGMRQLWETGWMHNRIRMVVASFLVKHLLISWQEGAKWFWETLVDADLGNNTLGWQWAGGCGADAAPYFRVFNPILQGKKFDADGSYVRRYVPEIAALPNHFIHCPWEAPEEVLRRAGVTLGEVYPRPIIGHKEGRERALSAWRAFKEPERQ